MKRVQLLPAALVLFAGMALQACSGGGSTAKEIAPGAFVKDEPIQVAQGKPRSSSRCFIDSVNGELANKKGTWTVKRGDGAAFSGWAYGKDGNAAADQLFIRITGSVQTYYAVTTQRFIRAETNEALKLPADLKIGYDLRAAIDQVEPGIYSVAILQALAGRVEICEMPVTLIVN